MLGQESLIRLLERAFGERSLNLGIANLQLLEKVIFVL